MKKIFITIFSAFSFLQLTSQSLQDVKRDLYYHRYESAKNKLATLVKINEVNPDAFYWLGEIYLEQGNMDSAYKVYMNGQILQKDYSIKEFPLIHVGWAHVLLDSGNVSASKEQMELILKETKYKNVDALLAVARANIGSKNGDVNWAITLLNRAVKRDKKNPEIYNALGDAYRKIIDGTNAIRNYDKALEIDPDNAEAMYKKGKIYKTQNNPEIYLDRFMKSYNMDSLYTPVLYELYKHYFYTDVVNAQKYLDKYLQNSDPDPIHLYMRADLFYISKKYMEAIKESEKIKMRDQDSVKPSLFKLVAFCNAALGDSMAALKNLDKYFEVQDSSGYVAKDFAFKASLLQNLSPDTSLILSFYKKALSIETDTKSKVDYIASIADLLRDAGQREQEAIWREQLYLNKQGPSNIDIYKWGMALYQSGNFVKADSVFGIYADKYPDQVHGYLYRARSNTFIDSTMEKGLAVPFYKKLLEVAGKDEEKNRQVLVLAYEYLAAYEANITKDFSASLEYYNKLLELDPGNRDAANNTQLLKKWMSDGKQDN